MELYRDRTAPAEERVRDLLSRMTLEEKCMQLGCVEDHEVYDESYAVSEEKMKDQIRDGIGGLVLYPKTRLEDTAACSEEIGEIQHFLVEKTRLGIPALPHVEALCGPWVFGCTAYPEPIGLAASWDPEKVQAMANDIRKELRAIGYRQVLSPVMDIARDPRWGRIGETYGEDPYLSSVMAVAYTKGIQGDFTDGILATPKHFLGYGYPVGGLNMATQPITNRELFEIFARPFDACCKEAGILSIMNSYGNIDGVPINESKEILTDLLRGVMRFKGFVISDYRSINRSSENFHTAKNLQEGGVNSLKAGLDMEAPKRIAYGVLLVKSVKEGKLPEEIVDLSCGRVLYAKFRLGLFENPYPESPETIKSVCMSTESKALSEKLAEESAVLLKNDGGVLPFSKKIRKLAVIGPNADKLRCCFSHYSAPGWIDMFIGAPKDKVFPGMEYFCMDYGVKMRDDTPLLDKKNFDAFMNHGMEYALKQMYPGAQTVLESIRNKLGAGTELLYAEGCSLKGSDRSGFGEALKAAHEADAVVMVMGGVSGWGKCGTVGEGVDTVNIGYFGEQEELIEEICHAAEGKPLAVVELSSRPISSPKIAQLAPAILHVASIGPFGGPAIADLLFGDANPGGKLPYTVARHVGQVPIYYNHTGGSCYDDNSIGFNADGYLDMTKYPLWYFGHGLSYTKFEYSDLEMERSMPTDGALHLSFSLRNIGKRAGDEVVQLYLRDELADVVRPVRQLAGFERVHLEAGQSVRVRFEIPANLLGFYDRQMRYVVEPGFTSVYIGSSVKDIRLEGRFEITGAEPREMLAERKFFAKGKIDR